MNPELHACFVKLKQDVSALALAKKFMFPKKLKALIQSYPAEYPDPLKAFEICQDLFDAIDWFWRRKNFNCLEPIRRSEFGRAIQNHPGLFYRGHWVVGYEIFRALANHTAPSDLVLCFQRLNDANVFIEHSKTKMILSQFERVDEPIRLRDSLSKFCYAGVFEDRYAMEYLEALVSEQPDKVESLVYLLLRLKECISGCGYVAQKFHDTTNSLYHKTLQCIQTISAEGDLMRSKKIVFLLKREALLGLHNMSRVLSHPYPDELYQIMVVLYERTMRNAKSPDEKQAALEWLFRIPTEGAESEKNWGAISELVLKERDIVSAINQYLEEQEGRLVPGKASGHERLEPGPYEPRESFGARLPSNRRPNPIQVRITQNL